MDLRPSGSSNAGLVVVGMLLGAFVLVAGACLTAITLTGASGSDQGASTALSAEPATDAITARLAADGWRSRPTQSVSLLATDHCAPPGWNSGATSRASAVDEHYSAKREDGHAVIGLTVYRTDGAASADLDRVQSDAWVDCQRREMQHESEPGSTAVLRRLAPDPMAPGASYSYSYREDDGLDTGTIHHVVVGRVRATITCVCDSLGVRGRQELARSVAAGLADLQQLPVPRR